MKHYLCLLRGGEGRYQKFSKKEFQAHMASWGVYVSALGEQYGGGAPIAPTGHMVKDWGKNTNAKPYSAGTPVNGYMILNANNYKDAVKLAKGCPIFEVGGSVEVREISKM